MPYARHEEDPGGTVLRCAVMPSEQVGLDAPLMNVLRKRAGVWVPVTPTLAEIDQLVPAMDGADPARWYWITT